MWAGESWQLGCFCREAKSLWGLSVAFSHDTAREESRMDKGFKSKEQEEHSVAGLASSTPYLGGVVAVPDAQHMEPSHHHP